MGHQSRLPVPVLVHPIPESGFWARVAAGVAKAASCLGGSIASAYHFVDPDVRRELATLPLMGLTAIGPRRSPVRAKSDDGHRPVVFVHGLAGHPGNFRAMAAWFRLQGRSRLYSVGLPRGRSAEEQSMFLARYIDAVLDANDLPAGRVDVVAHSRGGIVARLALEDVHVQQRVATLVTLGTPHRGTVTARYGRGRDLDELRPDSDLIRRLERGLPWTGPPMVCLWSGEDALVAPPEHARVEGVEERELPGLSHCGLLLRPAGWRAAYAAVSG